MIWQLYWEHTPMLVDDARGNCDDDIVAISRHDAEQITADLARRYWPPDAAQLPLGHERLSPVSKPPSALPKRADGRSSAAGELQVAPAGGRDRRDATVD